MYGEGSITEPQGRQQLGAQIPGVEFLAILEERSRVVHGEHVALLGALLTLLHLVQTLHLELIGADGGRQCQEQQ